MSLRYPIVPTPIIRLDRLGQQLSLNLYSKRDDLFFLSGGGSKARKLHYILNTKTLENFNAIVTAGDCQSNHLRATALFASKMGLKLICIVHSKRPEIFEGNLKITWLSGAELRFVEKGDVKNAMDTAMDDLRRYGFTPLYIWGGGHCVEGSLAYYDAAKELADQAINLSPDFIVLASGTGTTQAGLEVGVREYLPDCRVLGVSVSRSEQKGKSVILESMNELNEYLGKPFKLPESLFFDDRWIGTGYGAVYPEILKTITWAAREEGFLLDPTYTGKAFYALVNYVRDGIIPKSSNVIFWHTGGLLNLLASKAL